MINEAIFSGLITALARGESLQNAMFSFYNAGYEKQEIEEAARELYKQTGGQAEKLINPKKPLPETKAVLQGLLKPTSEPLQKPLVPESYFRTAPQIQVQPEVKLEVKKEVKPEIKKEPKTEPIEIVSIYAEEDNSPDDLSSRINTAIATLKNIKLPSKMEVISREAEGKSPVVIQRISDYGEGSPKVINKTVVWLIIILILLLGALAAIFFFKDKLIEIFNKLNL
jgi:hypothetical protein